MNGFRHDHPVFALDRTLQRLVHAIEEAPAYPPPAHPSFTRDRPRRRLLIRAVAVAAGTVVMIPFEMPDNWPWPEYR